MMLTENKKSTPDFDFVTLAYGRLTLRATHGFLHRHEFYRLCGTFWSFDKNTSKRLLFSFESQNLVKNKKAGVLFL